MAYVHKQSKAHWPPSGRSSPMMRSWGLRSAVYTAKLAGLPEAGTHTTGLIHHEAKALDGHEGRIDTISPPPPLVDLLLLSGSGPGSKLDLPKQNNLPMGNPPNPLGRWTQTLGQHGGDKKTGRNIGLNPVFASDLVLNPTLHGGDKKINLKTVTMKLSTSGFERKGSPMGLTVHLTPIFLIGGRPPLHDFPSLGSRGVLDPPKGSHIRGGGFAP